MKRREVREAEERYRIALRHSPVVFAWVDPDLRYEWIFNPHPDFDPESVVGKRDDELDTGPGIDALMALKRRVFARGEQEREEIVFARSDGDRTYDITATPVEDEDGRVIRVITASLDITARARAEAALRKSKREAEEANRVKTQFMSTMSHELRTPLTAVAGLTDLLETDVMGPTTDRQKGALARIRRATWHLTRVIDEVLAFSRSEAGKATVQREEVRLEQVAHDVLDILEHGDAEGVDLQLEGGSRPLPLETDRGKLTQILLNLCGNATKFARSRVVVELRGAPESVEVLVRDDGPGIPPDRLEEIFEPFTQLDSSPTREVEGTGLGLTIARRHARLLGGEIEVESRVGEGSTFALRLPRELP